MNHLNSKVILASASSRRTELLTQIGISHVVIPSEVEENVRSDSPSELVMELSKLKARDVAGRREEGEIIIGSDTVVAADGKILGKPKSHDEAYQMIERLQGRSHQVYTGVTIIRKGQDHDDEVTFFDETDVEIYPMSSLEIREYADSEEPMDKAGAYAVQGYFARYIKGLKGSYANVMGLPVSRVYRELKKLQAE